MIDATTALAISVLKREQQLNGSFLSYSSSMPNDFSQAIKHQSPFPAALIVNALTSNQNGPEIIRIREMALRYLLDQRSSHWSFNYWNRQSKQAQDLPYPDDLDDTFAALSAIYRSQPNEITGDALARIVTLLTSVEVAPGGPYRTWLIAGTANPVWHDVDIAVNAQVAYFLQLLGVAMPKLARHLQEQLRTDQLDSPYYPDRLATYYYLSRVVSEPEDKRMLLTKIDQYRSGQAWPTTLTLALTIISYRNLGHSTATLQELRRQLERAILKDGYRAHPFCYDPTLKGQPFYAGSPALTAAFCLEALAPVAEPTPQINLNKRYQQIGLRITTDFAAHHTTLPQPFHSHLVEVKDRIMRHNESHAICLLPALFDAALAPSAKKKQLTDTALSQLGLGHLYGWIAYTLADDLLDAEGSVDTLPIITLCLREMTLLFAEFGHDTPAFQRLFRQVMDRLEAANYWEVTNCRINPKKVDLRQLSTLTFDESYYADRSLGHALGPLAVLTHHGYKDGDAAIQDWLTFFTHYLTARQLNDDAHDWQTDLAAGQLNPVNVRLVQTYIIDHPKQSVVSVKTLTPKLEKLFWGTVLTEIAHEILSNTQEATAALERLTILTDTSFFRQLLHKPEKAAQEALREHKKTSDFIATYYQR